MFLNPLFTSLYEERCNVGDLWAQEKEPLSMCSKYDLNWALIIKFSLQKLCHLFYLWEKIILSYNPLEQGEGTTFRNIFLLCQV